MQIPGHEVTLAQQYAAIATASIPFFLLAGAGGVVFWVVTPISIFAQFSTIHNQPPTAYQVQLTIDFQVLGASLFFITAHAAFYNYDALEVPEDQEQLVGAIVEEV